MIHHLSFSKDFELMWNGQTFSLTSTNTIIYTLQYTTCDCMTILSQAQSNGMVTPQVVYSQPVRYNSLGYLLDTSTHNQSHNTSTIHT